MKFKKWLFGGGLVVLLFTMIEPSANAQVYIEGFGGWLWTARVPGYRQDLKVDDPGNYGARIGFDIQDTRGVEFEWNRTNTAVHYYDWDLNESAKTKVTFNYYMLGFL